MRVRIRSESRVDLRSCGKPSAGFRDKKKRNYRGPIKGSKPELTREINQRKSTENELSDTDRKSHGAEEARN